jgi:hypothetical protein
MPPCACWRRSAGAACAWATRQGRGALPPGHLPALRLAHRAAGGTTRHVDRKLNLERRLARSRAARSGTGRLAAYIEFWGNYIPEIHGVARALLVAQDTDAAAAWDERMQAMRDGCRAAIEALDADGRLAKEWDTGTATVLLWTLLSVRNWEQLTQACGWSSQQYIHRMQATARRTCIEEETWRDKGGKTYRVRPRNAFRDSVPSPGQGPFAPGRTLSLRHPAPRRHTPGTPF